MAKKVLVIDNDPDILDVVREVLDYVGFQVAACSGTKEIFNLIKEWQPDLLILDYRLDGKNGGDICRQLKSSALTSYIPVILYSTYPNVKNDADRFGCDAFIAKPFDLADLVTTVRSLIDAPSKSRLNHRE